jgi:regulatory protein
MNDQDTLYFRILDRVVNFISYRARSEREISERTDKYLSKILSATDDQKKAIKDRVFKELSQLRLIDDADFAQKYVADHKKSSRRALYSALMQKGLTKSVIESVLNTISDTSQEEQLIALSDKKIKTLAKYGTKTAKLRLLRYLLGKGYPPDMVYAVVDTKFKVK